MMSLMQKRWVVDRLRKLAAEEAVAGAHSAAAEHLYQAEAIEAGRDYWRDPQPDSRCSKGSDDVRRFQTQVGR